MTVILNALRYIRDNIYGIIAVVLLLLFGHQRLRNLKLEEENKELERDVHTLEIKNEANEVRSRPVSRDKSDILGRM